MKPQPLVLASTSIYRRELLARLKIPFQTAAPDINEAPLPGESARQTALRLAQEKARAVAIHYPDALIIGSDQHALVGEQQLGKPLTHEKARDQLRSMRGQSVVFYTALALLNTRNGEMQTDTAENRVSFRHFTDEQIESYLHKEQPYDCAGSAKAEGLGIALISRMEGDDPNALIGLPLILLVTLLQRQGVPVL
ncbi:MAG: Maf family nucleotide pyrophosphatase [Gallionellaceae bacterium]|nr:Maf family nucleotide pyrophosphatase [Gallionellaceae bacterium]